MDCSKWTLLWYSVFTITPIQHCARACKFLGASVNISKQSIIDVDRGDFDLNTAGMTLYIPSLSGHRTRKPICLYKESINFQKKDIIVALDRQAVCARRLKDGLCRSLTSVINNWSMGNIVTLLLVTIKEDTNENQTHGPFQPCCILAFNIIICNWSCWHNFVILFQPVKAKKCSIAFLLNTM